MKKFSLFFTSHPLLSLGVASVFLITFVGVMGVPRHKQSADSTAVVTLGSIVQEIPFTGTIVPAGALNLSFSRSGTVRRVAVKAGDSVATDQVLVELDSTELTAELAETLAKVASAETRLIKLQKGLSSEDLAKLQAEFEKAKRDLEGASGAVVDAIRNAYTKAEDAVRVKTDKLFVNDDTDVPDLTFPVSDSLVESQARAGRVASRVALAAWKHSLLGVSATSSSSTLVVAVTEAKSHLATIRTFLERAFEAVRSSVGVTASTTDSYQKNITLARTNIDSALANIHTKAQRVASREATVLRVANELLTTRSGVTNTQNIEAQEAKIKELKARVKTIQARRAELTLRSPIRGVVNVQDATLGETVTSKDVLVTIFPEGKLQVDGIISGDGGAMVEVGDAARVMLGEGSEAQRIDAKVISIRRDDTTHQITLKFLENEPPAQADMRVTGVIYATR